MYFAKLTLTVVASEFAANIAIPLCNIVPGPNRCYEQLVEFAL